MDLDCSRLATAANALYSVCVGSSQYLPSVAQTHRAFSQTVPARPRAEYSTQRRHTSQNVPVHISIHEQTYHNAHKQGITLFKKLIHTILVDKIGEIHSLDR